MNDATPGPGWYPDPWASGASRYWDGTTWTAKVEQQPAASPWTLPAEPAVRGETPIGAPAPIGARARVPRRIVVVGLVVVVAFVAGLVVAVVRGGRHSPTVKLGADQAVLAKVIARSADVTAPSRVVLVPGGEDAQNQPTLDICNATYASEGERVARRQVVVITSQNTTPFSTEAVLYRNPAGTALAFTELRQAAGKCPPGPVPSPVGAPTTVTKFNAAPDSSWPQTPSVERLAFDFTSTDDQGTTTHSIAVYLRRGRLLDALYFSLPDAQDLAIAGRSTIADVVTVFARRVAAVRGSVVTANEPRRV